MKKQLKRFNYWTKKVVKPQNGKKTSGPCDEGCDGSHRTTGSPFDNTGATTGHMSF